MPAIWMRLRAEWRQRRVSWLALMAILGVFVGVILGAAAGARRTGTAYDRFLAESAPWDVITFYAAFDPSFAELNHDEVAALPSVADSIEAAFYEGEGDIDSLASADPRFGRTFHVLKILDGRAADPDRPDEITIPYERVERLGVEVGDELTLTMHRRGPDASVFVPGPATERTFTVVGVHVMPGDFPPNTGEEDPFIALTPAFHRAHVDELFSYGAGLFRLHGGTAAASEFRSQIEAVAGGKPFFTISQEGQTAIAREALDLLAMALWALAVVLAVVGALAFGQALARQTSIDSEGLDAVRALGMTSTQLRLLGFIRVLAIGSGAAIVAVCTAIALSPATPIGIARIVEPDPGMSFDVLVLAIGAIGLVVTLLVLAAIPVWRAERTARSAGTQVVRRSRVAQFTARIGGAPTMVAGVRLALERGQGRSAVPVLTTIGTAAVGLAALVMASTFGSSLDSVLRAPELYGIEWDLEVQVNTDGSRAADSPSFALADEIAQLEGVADVAVLDAGIPLEVDGVSAAGIAFDPERPELGPDVLRGRRPEADDEVALGERTLREIGRAIGDEAQIRLTGLAAATFEIVGTAALPGFVTGDGLGEGTLLHPSALGRFIDDPPPVSSVYVRFSPDADRDKVRAQISEMPRVTEQIDPWVPSAITNLRQVRALPIAIAGLLAVLALAAIVHALLSSVRRRARELAVLRALGFVRGQVGAVVRWQAGTFVLAALLVGIPAGLAAGRWFWAIAAQRLGIVSLPQTPWPVLVGVLPAALLLSILIAAWPARAATRARPAVVLRAE